MSDADLIIIPNDAVAKACDDFIGWWALDSMHHSHDISGLLTEIRTREPKVFERAMRQAMRTYLRSLEGTTK